MDLLALYPVSLGIELPSPQAVTVGKMILPRPELLHLVNQQGRDHSQVKPDNHREKQI